MSRYAVSSRWIDNKEKYKQEWMRWQYTGNSSTNVLLLVSYFLHWTVVEFYIEYINYVNLVRNADLPWNFFR